MKHNIRIRLMLMGLKVKEVAQLLREENPNDPVLSILTPDKVSKATQDNYNGSERDRFIAHEMDMLVRELEKIYEQDPCCNPIKVRRARWNKQI